MAATVNYGGEGLRNRCVLFLIRSPETVIVYLDLLEVLVGRRRRTGRLVVPMVAVAAPLDELLGKVGRLGGIAQIQFDVFANFIGRVDVA